MDYVIATRSASCAAALLLGACAAGPLPFPADEPFAAAAPAAPAQEPAPPAAVSAKKDAAPKYDAKQPAALRGAAAVAPPPAPPGAAKPEPPAAARPVAAVGPIPFDGETHVLPEPGSGLKAVDLTIQPDDVWQRIRLGFAMPDIDNSLVQDKIAEYVSRPEYLNRIFERSRRYLYHIVAELEQRNMPTELALLPMVESAFNPLAYSRAHASGLWQFIPPTGKRYSLKQNWWFDARRDIVESTTAALDYLADLYDMHGHWHLALASYNYGENAVARAVEKNRAAGLPTDYAHLPLPLETRNYVPKLQALKNIIANPEPFGIVLDPIPNEPYFATIIKTHDIDVQLAAKLAEMPVEEFIALNPGFSRPFIPVNVNSRLVLPADKVELFHANLENYAPQSLVSWKTYRPAAGETLDAVARKFKVPLAQLKEVNGVTRRMRGTPQMLVVPVSRAAMADARLPIMYAPPVLAAAPRSGRIHVVKPGETLYSIARRYRVSVDNLKRWNSVVDQIFSGQRLRVDARARGGTAKGRPVKKDVKGKPRG